MISLVGAGVVVATLPALLTQCRESGDDVEPVPTPSPPRLTTEFEEDPARTVVYAPGRVLVATLTVGARTVVFNGPERVFREPASTRAEIHSSSWVRLAPEPWREELWDQHWFQGWFAKQIGDLTEDGLAASMLYLPGQPDDADFGLLREDDEVDGADFFDYLGTAYAFDDGGNKQPDPKWLRKLDCSGYLRIIYGHHLGFPLNSKNDPSDGPMPRSAWAIASRMPAVQIATGITPAARPPLTDLKRLLPGDLVFFALRSEDRISHSGMYIGVDQDGQHRFISSRGGSRGPTFGDAGSPGVLDSGTFGERFRRAIRI